MSATRASVTRQAAALGAVLTVEAVSPGWYATVEAPAGLVWACDGSIHELTARYFTDAPAMWAELAGRMAYGVERCAIVDCEWCAETTAAQPTA